MFNPNKRPVSEVTLGQAHLNRGEAGMVAPTVTGPNLTDSGSYSKAALNPQESVRAQQLMSNVAQNAESKVVGDIAAAQGGVRTDQLAESQAKQLASARTTEMIYAAMEGDSATRLFADPSVVQRASLDIANQAVLREKLNGLG